MIENELLTFVVTAALKGSAILGVAGVITVAWRSASAASRHLIWTLAIAWSLVLPLLGAALKRVKAPQIPVAAWSPADVRLPKIVEPPASRVASSPTITESKPSNTSLDVITASPPSRDVRQADDPIVVDNPSPVLEAAPSIPMPLPSLAWIWLAGVVVALIPLAAALIRVRGVARTARKTD